MSNLIKAAEELEYVPKEDLIRMAESGDSRFPPYLVLSEIQRRTQNEKAYSAMQPQPTTTVAEEKVAEFAQSGLGGMASPLFSPPPEDLPMSPPMQMAAGGYLGGGKIEYIGPTVYDEEGNELDGLAALMESGGLQRLFRGITMKEGGITGYANRGRTTYQDTFSYSPSIAGNVPISQQGLIRLLEERGITSEEEQEKITNILSSDLARFSQPRNIQIADVLRKSEDFISQPYKGIDSPFANIADRRGFAGEILEGVSPGPKMPEGYTPPVVATNQNGDNNNPFKFQEGDGKPPPNETTTPTTDVFGTLDELRKRMKDVEYKSPTADDLRDDRTSETLMYLGSLIAGSTSRKEFGQGLADLTSKVVASKRADDRFLNEAKLKERGLLSSDITLATALETLKAKAVQAKNQQMKNDIDLAQVLTVRLQTAIGDEKTLIENQINSLISPYISSGIVPASQADVDNVVKSAKS